MKRLIPALWLIWITANIVVFALDVVVQGHRGNNFDMLLSLFLAYAAVAILASDWDKIVAGLKGDQT